jgi:hypothetical protein
VFVTNLPAGGQDFKECRWSKTLPRNPAR